MKINNYEDELEELEAKFALVESLMKTTNPSDKEEVTEMMDAMMAVIEQFSTITVKLNQANQNLQEYIFRILTALKPSEESNQATILVRMDDVGFTIFTNVEENTHVVAPLPENMSLEELEDIIPFPSDEEEDSDGKPKYSDSNFDTNRLR